jgi:hypothetical protein
VNIHKTPVKVRSFPPYTLEKVVATLSAWKFSTLPGADEALAKLERLNRDFPINLYNYNAAAVRWEVGRKKPKTAIPPAWQFCEGTCEHALRR